MVDRVVNYFKGVRSEVARVSWPTRNEVITLTALILLLAVIMTLYIWGVDGVWGTLLKFLVRRG
jgi:preprotein translocase subunit SecE